MGTHRIAVLILPLLLLVATAHATNSLTSHHTARAQDSGEAPRIKKRDQLEIRIYNSTNYPHYKVDDDGMVDVALVGLVKAEGLTEAELAQELATRLKKYLKHPHVTVRILQKNRQQSAT